MSKDDRYLPFSQRNGLVPVPPQLQLGEASSQFRRLVSYCFTREIERVERDGFHGSLFVDPWKTVAADYHVKLLHQPIDSFKNSSYSFKKDIVDAISRLKFYLLFDVIEFFLRHEGCGDAFKRQLADAFEEAHMAYRVFDFTVIAIGTEEQARAFEVAISTSEAAGELAARKHLLSAGEALRNGKWADSVRESIHAVESIAKSIAPKCSSLGDALKIIERSHNINGRLKSGFEKIYGYTNDQGGIRHALSEEVARVDEVDALFMLGACASFVSYLIARDAALNGKEAER